MRARQTAQCTLFGLLVASNVVHADSLSTMPRFNMTPGVTSISHDIYDLHMTIFWICVAIGLVVFSVMFYSILYHRKSRGAKTAHFHEHLWLEITWTIIPFFILIAMAIPATRVLIHMHDDALPDITVKVTGFQWKWRYDYLDQGIHFFSNLSTPQTQIHNGAPKDFYYLREVDKPLVVPIHKKIRFLITSNDVIHSWWVPDFGIKHDAVPGFIYEVWARVNRPGIYRGQCAKLCGINHAFMPIVVNAVTEKEFAAWVAQQKGETPPPATTAAPSATSTPNAPVAAAPAAAGAMSLDELMKRGESIFMTTCSVCHKPDGTGMPPVFPALKGDKVTTGPLVEHINTVLNGHPGTAMQAFRDQLSDEEIAAVITYERHAFGNNMKEVIEPSDITAAKAKGKTP